MYDAGQVKGMLNDRAEAVCAFLLPAGFRKGDQWTVGNIANQPPSSKGKGGSLNIQLSGAKAGVWADFADAGVAGANLLDLWMKVRGLSFREAIEEAKAWLGLRDDDWQRAAGKSSTRPAVRQGAATEKKTAAADAQRDAWALEFEEVQEGSAVWKWLREERKISAETIRAYRIGEKVVRRKDGPERQCVVFPSYEEDGTLVRVKLRDIAEKGYMPTYPRGAEFCVFGKQAVTDQDGQVCITEGELDAMAMRDYMIDAVSVPYGAKGLTEEGKNPNDPWIEHDYDWLEGFADVLLALDADEEGRKATAAIAPRLRRERVRILDLPRGLKDANSCLQAGVTQGEMFEAIAAARNLDPAELRRAREYRAEVWEAFYPAGGEEPGWEMPWALPFRFRPAEVTLWHGYTKHGKTVLMQYVVLWLAAQYGEKACVASMEIPAVRTLQNTMRQLLAKRKPESEQEFDGALNWLDRHFFVYDCLGTARTDAMLDCFGYAVRKYGVSQLVVDSLMKMDIDEEDNDAMKQFMNRLTGFAAEYNVHVHLVAHDRKPDVRHPEEKFWPGKYQIRGSAHLPDLAHNVVCVWRNKSKEVDWKNALDLKSGMELQQELEDLKQVNDAILAVQAQRGGDGDEPEKRLWFDAHGSWQYRDEAAYETRRFLDEAGSRN